MRLSKSFKEFISDGTVKTQSPDLSRANFLAKESERDYEARNIILKKAGLDDKNANIIIKTFYDVLMEMIRAKMLIRGYKAEGFYAHEAEVSYLKEIGITDNDVHFANQLRYFRNRMTYYGKVLDRNYAEDVLKFMARVYPGLKEK
ncbi:hypothetical protein HYT58_00820 [Candidatus Woesearchaeota archaeon]|nr:hypothetical protein [Candidatus Woesearchaeota archaeon]